MFVLSILEAPNTKTNSLCVQTHLAIKLFLILNLNEKKCDPGLQNQSHGSIFFKLRLIHNLKAE